MVEATASPRGSDLDARLRRLEDAAAIRELLAGYVRGADQRDPAAMLSLYHDGATDDHGTFRGLATDYVAHAQLSLASHYRATQHVLGASDIVLNGDRAHVRTHVIAVHRKPTDEGPDTVQVVGGSYFDEFERRNGCWGVVRRQFQPTWQTEGPESDWMPLMQGPAAVDGQGRPGDVRPGV